MKEICYVVAIKDKLNNSTKAAKFMRYKLHCKNVLERGGSGYTGGYLFLMAQDINYRWGKIRHIHDIFHNWRAYNFNLVFLDSDSDFIGAL